MHESLEGRREQVGAELEMLARRGLELQGGRTVPLAVIPADLRLAYKKLLDDGRVDLATPRESTFHMLQRMKEMETLPKGVSAHDVDRICERLRTIAGVDARGMRTVVFDGPMALLEGVKSAVKNGGAGPDAKGTCIDHLDRWMRKYLSTGPRALNPAVVFLYDMSKLERISEEEQATNVTLAYYGFKPRGGGEFTDALMAAVALV